LHGKSTRELLTAVLDVDEFLMAVIASIHAAFVTSFGRQIMSALSLPLAGHMFSTMTLASPSPERLPPGPSQGSWLIRRARKCGRRGLPK
jgi:hypothetical protein